jgi:hypothetical protein
MLKQLPLWLYCLSVTLLYACKEDFTVEEGAPVTGPGWQLASGFTGDSMVIRNSVVSNGQLYVMRDKYLSVLQKNGSASHMLHGQAVPFALPLNSNYFVGLERNPDVLIFAPTANPNHPKANRIRMKPSDLGPDIVSMPQFNNSRLFASNDKGQMMTVFWDKASRPVFFVFDVILEKDTISRIKAVNYRRIPIASVLSSGVIQPLGQNFLVPITAFFNVESRTVLIAPNGAVTTASKDQIYQVIDLDSILFATGTNGLYESRNKGFSWEWISNSFDARGQALSNLSIMQGYTKVNDQFVLYTTSEITTIESPKGAIYNRRRLSLDGLDQSDLIGIHEWGGRVFAVTERGVYMRTIGNFFR